MASSKAMVGLLIAGVIAMTLFTPVLGIVNSNTGTVSVTNESVTADVGNYVNLDGYDLDANSDTVYWLNSSSGNYEQVTESTDYEIADSNGSIKALSSGSIGDGDSLKVSYDYQATSGSTTTVANLVPLFILLLVLGVFAQYIQGAI